MEGRHGKDFLKFAYLDLEDDEGPTADGLDFRFELDDGGKVGAHFLVMKQFCRRMVRTEGPAVVPLGGPKYFVHVPDGIGKDVVKAFVKAVYLDEYDPDMSLETWRQLRRLAVEFECASVLRACEGIQVTPANAHVIFETWPGQSDRGLKGRALDFMKGNLTQLIGDDVTKNWSMDSWKELLLRVDDLPTPAPTEDQIFNALIKWKNHAGLGVEEFRTAFKDLLRYPLMTEKLLMSDEFRDTGMIIADKILDIIRDVKKRPGESTVNNTVVASTDAIATPNRHPPGRTNIRSLVRSKSQSPLNELRRLENTPSWLSNSRISLRHRRKETPGAEQNGNNNGTTERRSRKRCHSKTPDDNSTKKRRAASSSTPCSNARQPARNGTSTPIKKTASNFHQLEALLTQDVVEGMEIQLLPGVVYDGKLDLQLPRGVKIYGAGATTILTNSNKSDGYIWKVDAGKGLKIENVVFKVTHRNDPEEMKGLWVTGNKCNILKVSFIGCHLELGACEHGTLSELKIISSYYGIVLDRDTSTTDINGARFKDVWVGIFVHGRNNKISNVHFEEVEEGVIFHGSRDPKKDYGSANSLDNMTYTFWGKKCEQVAVKIYASHHNLVSNLNCLGYKEPATRGGNMWALWVQAHEKKPAIIPTSFKIKGVAGGPRKILGVGLIIPVTIVLE